MHIMWCNNRMVNNLSFAENLSKRRNELHITRKELSDMLGIPYSTYNNYECGDREPKYKVLIKIAQLLQVTVDELLGLETPAVSWLEIKHILDDLGFCIKEKPDESITFEYKIINKTKSDDVPTLSVGTFNKNQLLSDFSFFKHRASNHLNQLVGDYLRWIITAQAKIGLDDVK